MKQGYNKIIVAVLSAFTIAGAFSHCTKLDDNVYTTIVADKYPYTENDLVRILGNAYTPWRNVVMGAMTQSQEISADATLIPVHPWGWNGTTINMHLHSWTSETGEATGRWGELYTGINNANQVIYQLESGLIPITDPDQKASLLAELRAVRASYYYMLCDYFGNVPYVTDFNVPQGFLPLQTPRAALYDSIVGEIKSSLPYLSDKVDQSTYGRFTKWGAYALLAKMYLNAQVYSGKPHWQDCINACDSVINSAKFSLSGNHKDIFRANNSTSTEAVFAVPFDQSYASGLQLFNWYLNGQFARVYTTKSGGGWGGSVAIPQFINTFDPEDTRLTDDYLIGQQKYPDGTNVNCEIGESAGKPMNLVNMVPGLNWAEELHGYHLAKYEYVAGMSPGAMSNDIFPFRYTDVLMMKAECLLRLGKANEAAAIVTQVRQRAFKNNPAKAVVTGPQLIQGSSYDYGLRETNYSNKITNARVTHEGGGDIEYGRFLDELGWEFNQEGRRRQDMIRFGIFTTKSWLSHQATNNNNKILYLIPQTEIDKNPNLKQNNN